MSITRVDLPSDAVWQRAWEVANPTELATLIATYTSPLGPKRGDIIRQQSPTIYYLVTIDGNLFPISGLASLPVSLTTQVSGILPTANGGTNINLYTQGDILYSSATNILSKLAKDTNATRYLSNTGASNAPAWNRIVLTDGVSGVLPTANGGTSVDIASAALPLGSGQITFPSTANPSSNANTLDDYKEGTWIPIDSSGAGLTFSFAFGSFTKIGRAILFNAQVTYPSTANGTAAKIGGLPYTGNPGNSPVYLGYHTSALAFVPMMYVIGSSTTIQPVVPGTGANVTNAQLSTSNTIFGGIYYAP